MERSVPVIEQGALAARSLGSRGPRPSGHFASSGGCSRSAGFCRSAHNLRDPISEATDGAPQNHRPFTDRPGVLDAVEVGRCREEASAECAGLKAADVGRMDNHAEQTPNDNSDEVFDHVHRYNPTLLTGEQTARMLEDIKAAVLAAEPANKTAAGHLLSALCGFVADLAPRAGCALGDVLTDVQLARWSQDLEKDLGAGRTLGTKVGLLRRILRARKGLPATIAVPARRRLVSPPLSVAAYFELSGSCRREGGAALRAFAAAFGAGVVAGDAIGCRFVAEDGVMDLILPSGVQRRVIPEVADMPGLDAATVLDGDWDELRDLGGALRIFVDRQIVWQTFRERVLCQRAALWELTVVYGLSGDHLDAIAPHLPPVDVAADRAVAEMLRGAPRKQIRPAPLCP